jgi:ParB-like chromosome segregation protein Spo0J
MNDDIITVDPREVTFLIHRDRDPVRFELVKDSIRELGVIQPLHVRDITDWPAKDRRRPDGGLYKWQAMFGEGRCTALIELHSATQDARFLRCPAIVKVIPPGEIVGRFLAENILRRDLPWADQARLIRAEVEQRLRENTKAKPRTFIREIAQHYFITEGHAAKLLRILSQASVELSRSLQKFTLEEAETIVALPQAAQDIVMETLHEEGLERSQVTALVRKARETAEAGPLTKTALKQAVRRVNEDLSRQREQLKLYRLHHSNGPENLKVLLS